MSVHNHFAGLAPDPIAVLSPAQAGELLTAKKATFDAAERPGYGMANPATPTHARNRLDELSADPKWRGKLLSHDEAVRAEFEALTAAASAGGAIEHALNGVVPSGYAQTGTDDLRAMTSFVADARGDGWDDVAIVEAMSGIDSKTKQPFNAETVRQAKNLRAELFSDADWRRKYLAGDRAAVKRSQYLSIIIGSEQSEL